MVWRGDVVFVLRLDDLDLQRQGARIEPRRASNVRVSKKPPRNLPSEGVRLDYSNTTIACIPSVGTVATTP